MKREWGHVEGPDFLLHCSNDFKIKSLDDQSVSLHRSSFSISSATIEAITERFGSIFRFPDPIWS